MCVSLVSLHVNTAMIPGLRRQAYRGLLSLILEILSHFNEWCKIGTYVSLFPEFFIMPGIARLSSHRTLRSRAILHEPQTSHINISVERTVALFSHIHLLGSRGLSEIWPGSAGWTHVIKLIGLDSATVTLRFASPLIN